jgi:hypothetical protein
VNSKDTTDKHVSVIQHHVGHVIVDSINIVVIVVIDIGINLC